MPYATRRLDVWCGNLRNLSEQRECLQNRHGGPGQDMLSYVRMRSLLICLASFELLSVTACNQTHHPLEDKKTAITGYDLAIKSGLQNSPDPKAFKELFPQPSHSDKIVTMAR